MSSSTSSRLKSALFRSLRFGFRLLPLSEARRDDLRRKFLDRYSNLVPASPRGQLSDGTMPRRAYVRADERAIGYVPYKNEALPDPLPARLIAFYLPQFHTIPENDEWWGKGFTEWRNVTRALPQFEGHQQPLLPGDLGFYDLSNPEVMREQTRLAREYGISAFCSYFYWFGGKTLLEKPLRNWLANPTIDFPICLCWANENWTRTWDGRASEVLIEQRHSPEDDIAFIQYVSEYMRDPRYLRVDGKPMLLVYRPGLLPDAKATTMRWRQWCSENGIGELHLAYVQSFERPVPEDIGFDAAVEFPPNLSNPPSVSERQCLLNNDFDGQILDWRELANEYKERSISVYNLYPGVNCGWDNEPRRSGRGRVYHHASPRGYRDWLQHTIYSRVAAEPIENRLVFINAWNEWAEGAVLEPTACFGHAWLQATRDAVRHPVLGQKAQSRTPAAIIHVWHLDAFGEILQTLRGSGLMLRLFLTTTHDRLHEVESLLASHGQQAQIFVTENRGRDILPFLRLASQLLDAGEDIVLKLHTKRSLHRDDGHHWRRELVDGLLGGSRGAKIIHAMEQHPDIGMVAPERHLLPLHEYLGANGETLEYLTRCLGLPATPDPDVFASGSMFWVRLTALRPLLDATLHEWEFEPERSQADGTIAHAVERIFARCVQGTGSKILGAATLCGESVDEFSSTPYSYAKRT